MTLEEARKGLKQMQLEEFAYRHAMGILSYDGMTGAPKDTTAPRGATLSVLSEKAYQVACGPEAGKLLDFLDANRESLDQAERRTIDLKLKNLRELRRIPMEEYVAYTALLNEASDVWHRAKDASDYGLFEPYLSKIVEANRRFAALVEPDKAPYDYLLDQYEEGLTMARCDEFFGALKSRITPLVERIKNSPRPDTAFIHKSFPVEKQSVLSDRLMELMRIDRGHCGIATTEHPFTTDFSKYDVRITTKYKENDFTSSMYSVIHEGGHALYELHTADEFAYTELGTGISMGVHESQSRLYENIIGRSLPFIKRVFPIIAELCPEMGKHTPDELYKAVNMAEPSLIRTEADELTYYLHIMVRYELEKALITGELSTKELPERWNLLYKEYLGVDVPDDRAGVLQDSHWSGGAIGYFPSYALGSAYGAQLMAKMRETVDVDGCVLRGDLAPINQWLEQRIWRFGKLYSPTRLMEQAMEAPFDPTYYMDYLEDKYSALYGLR